MTDQRVGRHIRIYEWDEVDIEEDTLSLNAEPTTTLYPQPEKKAVQEQPKGLSALLKKKIF